MKSLCFLPLSQGEWAVVDLTDAARAAEHKWTLTVKGKKYAYRGGGQHLHTFIQGVRNGSLIDHVNGDGLDNRRENLRFASRQENGRNATKWKTKTSSKFKGVSFHSPTRRWRAYIVVSAKQKHLGLFETESLAAAAYDDAARELFGGFAKFNL